MALQVKFPYSGRLRLRQLQSSINIPQVVTSNCGLQGRTLQTCVSCDFSTRHRILFDRHVNRCEHGLRPPQVVACNYKCKKCNFATTRSRFYLHHLKRDHGEVINIFSCDLCEYASRYRCKVIRHRKFVHRTAKPITSEALCEDTTMENEDNLEAVNRVEQEQHDLEIIEAERIDGIHEMEQGSDDDFQILKNDDVDESALSGTESEKNSVASVGSPVKATDNALHYIRRIASSPESQQPAYQCAFCTYSNVQKWKVANHVRTFHMKNKVFKCSFCPYVTSQKIEFCIHKTKHSKKEVLQCQECDYQSLSRTNFDRHLANHSANLPVKCGLCNYSSTTEAIVQHHIKECHPQDELAMNNASCDEHHIVEGTELQAQEVDKSENLTINCELNQDEMACRVCGLKVKNESKLRIHMVSHSTESVHWCPLCTLKYKRSSDLNRHMKRKHGARLRDFFFMGQQEQPLNLTTSKSEMQACILIEPSSVEPEVNLEVGGEDQPLDLTVTKSTNLPLENLKCFHCSYHAKWPSDLRRHLLVHSIEKRFKCPCCHRKYKYQFDLNMHLRRMHRMPAGRTKVFTASVSPSVVNVIKLDSGSEAMPTVTSNVQSDSESVGDAASSDAPKHMLKVNRYKLTRQQVSPQGKYKCDYCPYLGKYQSEVDRHMRLHTGEKPFSCLFCAYRSHWRGDMKRHLQKHHSSEDGVEDNITNLMEQTYQPDAPAESCDQSVEAEAEAEGNVDEAEVMDVDEPENQELGLNGKEMPGDPGSDQDGMEFMTLTPSSSSSGGSTNATPNNKAVNGEKRQNLCPYCPFTCEAPSKLKCHMEIHENLKRFKCAHCGKRSNWTWDVRKHIKKEHPSKELNVIVMEEEEARETLTGYLQSHVKVLPKKELPPPSELPTQVPLNRFTDQLPPLESMGVLAPLHPSNLTDSSYQEEEDGMSSYAEPKFSMQAPSMRHPSIATKRCRPFKCSKCGRRSNWKWDMNKHIRNVHPQAKLIILTPEEARATMPKGGFKNSNMGRKENVKMVLQTPYIKPENPSPQKPKHNHQFDSNRTKKFKCSSCPYRSDYRSDIGRHLKRLHSPGTATIQMLSDDEARAKLQEYKDRWVRGKFVFSPAKEKLYNEVDQQNAVGRKAFSNVLLNQSKSASQLQQMKQPQQNIGDQNQQPLQQQSIIMTQTNTSVTKSEPSTVLMPPCTERTKKWKCPKCAYQNPNKKMVMRHMRQHPKVKVFQCRMCGEASDYRNSMYRHVRNRHNSTDYSGIVHESIAYVTTVVKSEPEASLNADEDVPVTYRCTLCAQTSSWKSGIMRHVAETHNKEKVNEFVEVIHVSNILPALPQQVTNSGVIYFMSPDDAKQLRCDVCPYRTNKSGLLKIHKTYHHPQPGNKFKCKYCPYYVSAMRLLHQHVRLHIQELPFENNNNDITSIKREDKEEEQMELDLSSGSNTGSLIDATSPLKVSTGSAGLSQSSSPGRRYYCDQCPAVSRNKNDFLYHKQFHRPKPFAPFKCRLCNYWVSQRRLLRQHERVHLTEYIEHYHNNSLNSPKPEVLKTYADKGGSIPQMVLASPAKSDISDYGDPVQIANIKQQIIASKIQTVPITPKKFQENESASPENALAIPGLMVDMNGQYLNHGTLRTLNKCNSCPFTCLHSSLMERHEKMHEAKPTEGHLQCPYCSFYVPNKKVLVKHAIVHSSSYQPGIDEINDVDFEEDEGDDADKDENADEKVDNKTGSEPELKPGAAISLATSPERPQPEGASTGKDIGGTVLDLSCLSKYSEFYVKYDSNSRQHQLERGSFKKWCCEKCPYASMKRAQFERHITLHASGQKYVCEYCDYSVPAYHLLLQHKKLHLHPNPNLLTVQSISNLQRLPEVPADVAAASNFLSNTTDPASQFGSQDSADLFENSSEFSEPKKLYRCDRCPYTNVRRDHLLSHLRFHMVLSDFKCPYCDYSVTKQHLLVQHIKVHFNAPGCEGFNAPNSVLNLSIGHTSLPCPTVSLLNNVDMEQGQSKDSADNDDAASQPEYIDLAELSKAGLLKPVRATDPAPESEPDRTSVENAKPEKSINIAEKELAPKEVDDVKETQTGDEPEKEEGMKSGDNGCDKWVCQYCDRRFKVAEDMLKHETRHLVGNHF